MLESFQKLRDLVARPSHTYAASVETFQNLDTQRLIREMELVKKGKTRGELDQPSSETATLDFVEEEIVEHIGAAQKRSYDELENHLAGFRQRLIDLDFENRFSHIDTAAQGNLSDLKQELEAGIDDLHPLRKELLDYERDHARFKERNKLYRPGNNPSPRATTIKVMVIIALVLAELVVNGQLLSKGSELGLVGGIVEAILFAALNVGVALMFATVLGVKNINHRNWFRKLYGLIATVAYLLLAVAINLSLAHYREVAASGLEAGTEVLNRIREQPFELTDFNSWLLFGIGIMFSLIAFFDGLAFGDPYPGYRRVDKALRKAQAKYADVRRESIQQLGEIRKEYEDVLRQATEDLSRQRTEHRAIVSHRSRMVSLFAEHQSQLEKAANAILRSYRDTNIAARTTPAPGHFAEQFRLEKIEPKISKEGEFNTNKLDEKIARAQQSINLLFGKLEAQFEEAMARYRALDDLSPDK
jgi:hypothetical protein